MPNDDRSGIKQESMSTDDQRFLDEHRNKLSDSTVRARWIGSTDEREERRGQTLATRNHDVIKQWAAERKGAPATVPGTEHDGRPRVLRFDFPGFGGKDLEHISWERWFETFDARDLVFVYQDHKSNGSQSNFFHFDSPYREHQ